MTTLPAWDRGGYGRPGWGLGGGGWGGNWHNNSIHPHFGWYNGSWNQGYWGSNWYRPLAWTSVGWGLGRVTSGWGYGATYSNPYYVASPTAPFDYSQPVVVNNYVSSDAMAEGSSASAAPETVVQVSPQNDASFSDFDEGLALFKSGDYEQALLSFDKALKEFPGDPVVHEVRALTLFALGQFKPAAASLNAFLSSAPGMDWTTLSGLYGNTDDYTAQLAKLERFCIANPMDASAFFVLAYHYLVIGEKDKAIKALQVVVANEPNDTTAKRMLDALSPPPAAAQKLATELSDSRESTDLVGTWKATTGTTTVELLITEDSKFTWKATEAGQAPVELNGDLTTDSDAIVLVHESEGSMAGVVKSQGENKWTLLLDGAPSTASGLSFIRVGA